MRFVTSQRVNFKDCVFITLFSNLIKDGLFQFGGKSTDSLKTHICCWERPVKRILHREGTFKSSAFDTHPKSERGREGTRWPSQQDSWRGPGTPTPTVEGNLKGRRSGFNLRNAAEPYFTRPLLSRIILVNIPGPNMIYFPAGGVSSCSPG